MGNVKNELKNFQNIPRGLIFDSSISDRARFVYCYMCAKPDDWNFYIKNMSKEIGYSEDTLRKYINELISSGWLSKYGQTTKGNGTFGNVEYEINQTKKTDTEKSRHGEKPTRRKADTEKSRHGENTPQTDIDINTEREILNKEDKDKSLSKKVLFEECWKEYRRKGSKKISQKYWDKLSDKETEIVLPHIKAYVQANPDIKYTKDFERYLRDKIFTSIVYKNNVAIYDPERITNTDEYRPQEDISISWNEYSQAFIASYNPITNEMFADGYTKDDRPNNAKVRYGGNNFIWKKDKKEWEIE